MNAMDAFRMSEILLNTGVPEIDILGGEPMLIPWMKDFIKHVSDAGITLNISTNGSLLEGINQLSEIYTDNLNIGFSVHGFTKTHNGITGSDNYSQTIKGIKRLIEAGHSPIVKSVLVQQNKNEISGLISYFAASGVRRYYLLHEDRIGRQTSADCFSFPEFLSFCSKLKIEMKGVLDLGFITASGFYKYGIHKQGRCDAGITKLAIMPDGSVFPCNLFAGFEEFRLGNIFEEGIEKIWNNPVLERFRRYNKNRCKLSTCEFFSACSGGCPAHSYYFCGSFDRSDPRCLKEQ
jgi:radical SAM protein with 4Fe4S-binding SPASM domain